jgi:NitT/TauT family transport system permease protein
VDVGRLEWRRLRDGVVLCVSIPFFLTVWHVVSTAGFVNRLLFPAPTVVAGALYREAVNGALLQDVLASGARVVAGYVSGALVAILIGLLTGCYRPISNLLAPLFQLLRPIPPIAFVPIVVLWFGLSEWGKWFLVFWGAFFPVWIATHLGVQRPPEGLIRAARSLGARDPALIREVIFPAALPMIFVGLRAALGVSFYTLVAAEMAGTFAGVAYRIEIAHQNMQTAHMMGCLVVLGVMSALADRVFSLLSHRLVWWS